MACAWLRGCGRLAYRSRSSSATALWMHGWTGTGCTSTQREHVLYVPVSPMRSGIGSWRQSDGQVAASFSSMSSCTSCSASRTP